MAAGGKPELSFLDEMKAKQSEFSARALTRQRRRPAYLQDYVSGNQFDSSRMELTGGSEDDAESDASRQERRSARRSRRLEFEASLAEADSHIAAWNMRKEADLARLRAEEYNSDDSDGSNPEDFIAISDYPTPQQPTPMSRGPFPETSDVYKLLAQRNPLQPTWRQQGIVFDKGPFATPSTLPRVPLNVNEPQRVVSYHKSPMPSGNRANNNAPMLSQTTQTWPPPPPPSMFASAMQKPMPPPRSNPPPIPPKPQSQWNTIPKARNLFEEFDEMKSELEKMKANDPMVPIFSAKNPIPSKISATELAGMKKRIREKAEKFNPAKQPALPSYMNPRKNIHEQPTPKIPFSLPKPGESKLLSEYPPYWWYKDPPNPLPSKQDDSDDSTDDDDGKANPSKPVEISPKTTRKKKSHVDDVSKAMMLFVNRQGSRPLPIFSGETSEWPAFYAEYNDSNRDCKFTESQQMSRLRAALKGKARQHVQEYLMLPKMADKIMESLSRLYGRPEFIIDSLIEKTRRLECPRANRPETLINFSTSVNTMSNVIQAMKCSAHLNNPMLVKELVAKLSSEMKLKWGRYLRNEFGTTPPNIADFAEWFSEVAEDASYIYTPSSQSNPQPEKKQSSSYSKPKNESTYVAQKNELTSSSNAPPVTASASASVFRGCAHCTETTHSIGKCPKFLAMSFDSRSKWVQDQGRCFRCLCRGHRTKDCKVKTRCPAEGCGKPHHKLLHRDADPVGEKKAAPVTAKPQQPSRFPAEAKPRRIYEAKVLSSLQSDSDQDDPKCVTVMGTQKKSKVLYRIGPVKLYGPKGEMTVYAFFDDGSSVSLLSHDVALKLGLEGSMDNLKLGWLKKEKTRTEESMRVTLGISGTWPNAHRYSMKDVRTMNELDLPCQSIHIEKLSQSYPHLKNLKVSSYHEAKPCLLIGLAHLFLGIPLVSRYKPFDGPVASKTRLGWIIHGTISKGNEDSEYSLTVRHEDSDVELKNIIQDSFSTESFGVAIPKNLPQSKESERAKMILQKTSKRIGRRFETGLLWRNDEFKYPESKNMAMRRLFCTESRLLKDPILAKSYQGKIDDYLLKGYARKLTAKESQIEFPRTWYLPHFPVTNPNKPGKVRLVFDASAVSHGVSFNSALLTGPDLLQSLPVILLRFRRFKVAFCGDIKEFFHQVNIIDEDVNAQRFLWRNLDVTKAPETYLMTAMIFGSACSPCSAQYVKNLNADEFSSQFPAASKSIKDSHYMDDWIESVPTEQQAQKLIHDVIHVHRQAGLEICNFTSSSRPILQSLPPELIAIEQKNLCVEQDLPTERVLGIYWDPNEDMFVFQLKFHKVPSSILSGEKIPTKREVLKVTMSIFDPLGLISHFTIQSRILFKEIWRTGIDWDSQLDTELNKDWRRWLENLDSLKTLKIPRCISTSIPEAENIQLHIMCDAGEDAFAACAFLRVKFQNVIDVGLLIAKARVSPLKILSIPKLELQAAVMATRLRKTVVDTMELKIEKTFFWSDSQAVIKWIRSDARKYKQFVAFRIGEILDASQVNEWRWISTKLNVADMATKKNPRPDLSGNSTWFTGPLFLTEEEDTWPDEFPDLSSVNPEELEMKKKFIGHVNVDDVPVNPTKIPLPNPDVLNNWTKLVRSTAFMIRFIMICTGKGKCGELTVDELKVAEKLIFKTIQEDSYGQEILKLKAGKPLKGKSPLYQLSPVLHSDGILRLHGRLQLSHELTDAAKNLIILPPKNPLTRLMIQHYHEEVHHHGQETVVNLLRQKFWIPKVRSAVRSVWANCQECKNRKARPVIPEMGNLPLPRVTRTSRAFVFTGVDYFGPMMVTVGRRHEKRWGVLFTCLVTRAVHLELASSLDTNSCIIALQNFFRRRGRPQIIWSDNGTNLVGAETELKKNLEELNQSLIHSTLALKNIDWRFTIPAAPHSAGAWERLVQSVKKVLKNILHEQAPRHDVLQNLLIEAEYTINCRPLTHVSLDHEDDEVLTPNHFLLGSASGDPPPGEFKDRDLICLRSSWRYSQRLADRFWTKWTQEYLPTLTKRAKWFEKVKPIAVGDIVVVIDPTLMRNTYPRGIVLEVHTGKDGQVRSAEVKTAHGIYRRPVTKLAKLDVRKPEDCGVDPTGSPHGGEDVAA